MKVFKNLPAHLRKVHFLVLFVFCSVGSTLLYGQAGPGWHNSYSSQAEISVGAPLAPPEAFSPSYSSQGETSLEAPEQQPPALPAMSEPEGPPPPGMLMMMGAGSVHPEIEDLAQALGNDPLSIFNWVRNNIDYIHYRGAKKGSLTTLVERSGNDYDQSLLLRDLLAASGVETELAYGLVVIPYVDSSNADVRHWLGLPQAEFSNTHFDSMILNRGTLPTEVYKDQDNVSLYRVWIIATIGAQTYHMDPSFKRYEPVAGIDLVAGTQYVQSGAFGELGGTVGDGDRSISGASELDFNSYMVDRSLSLLDHLSQPANAFKSPIDVTGGWRLVEWNATQLSNAFPLTSLWYTTWQDVPEENTATLSLNLGPDPDNGQTVLTLEKPLPELQGRRLTLEFSKSGATTKAQIWLDDELWGEEPAFVAGTTTKLNIKIDHPTDNNNFDQGFTQTYKRTVTANGMPNGTAIYSISYGYDVTPESFARRQRILDEYREAGKADTSREVKGETLNVIGQQWYLQTQLMGEILANLTGCAAQNHHRIGRVAQEEGVYIDVIGQHVGVLSRVGDFAEANTAFTVSSVYQSAMEHGVLDQLQNLSAASTVGLVARAIKLGHKVFVLKSPADYTAIQGQLVNYTTGSNGQLAQIQDELLAGATVVLPANGDLRISPSDLWHGAGFVHASPTKVGMIISGGYNGGYSTNNWATAATVVSNLNRTSSQTITYQPPATPTIVSRDPVDLSNGAFFLEDQVDLAVGSTLAHTRSYHGSRRTDADRDMGYGWTHGGHIRVSRRTNVEHGLGQRSASDMAATLASAVVVLDLYRTRDADSNYQKKWLGCLFAAKWGVQQLKSNSVSVQLPDKNLEFTRRPGTIACTPPPGVQMTLVESIDFNTGPFVALTPRHGATFLFEPVPNSSGEYRIEKITDLWSRVTDYTYDGTTGKLTQIADPFGRSLSFTYANGRISSVSDSTGRSVSYGYDENGNLTTFTDAEGKQDHFLYDDKHRIVESKDHDGRSIVKNFYDDRSRVIEQHNQALPDRAYTFVYGPGVTRETDPAGGVTRHLFDDRGRGIGRIDALGHRYRVDYDARDHVVKQTSPLGRVSTAVYDRFDNLTSTTDASGATTTYGYDGQHRLTSVTDPLNRTTSFTYNAKHQQLTITNPLNETATKVYDSATGNLTSSSNHVGHTTSYEYDAFDQLRKTTLPGGIVLEQSVSARGDVVWSKDARGVQTDFTYNQRREPLTSSTGGRTTRIDYDDNRMAWRTTNARGLTSTSTYSPTGKVLSAAAPDGTTVSTAYDTRDNPQVVTGPLGEVIQTLHDPLNRAATVVDPLNRSVTTVFDEDGMAAQVQAPLGRVSTTDYQIAPGQPRLVTATDPLNRSTISQYDAAGQHRFLTNRNGEVFEMTYDGLGRITSTIQPGGRTQGIAYSWNATGAVQTLTEPSGQTTTLQHDALGRLVSKVGPDATTNYSYDTSGNLLTVTEGPNVLTRTYEGDRNLVSTYTNAEGETIGYAYDANGNLTTLTYPGGRQVRYGYDVNDRLVRLTDWAGRVTRFEYDASGRLTAIKRPNGTVRRTVFDLAGQLSSIAEISAGGETIAYQGWRYDAGGRPTQRLRVPEAAPFANPEFSATYHPDNRFESITPSGGGPSTVSSDLDGNLLAVPIWETAQAWASANFAWDARNRLTSATAGSVSVGYRYDAEGNLIERVENLQTTRYTVNPNAALSQVLITHRPDGGKIFHVYGAGLLYEESFDAGGASLGTRSYHYDQVGSTVALTDDGGTVTGRLEYTAYGLTSHTSGSVDTPFRYNGAFGVMTDAGTGLLSMRARWYSPSLGRFLNPDPIGFAGGMNFYAYADGDPINALDPFGLSAWSRIGGGFQALGGALEFVAGGAFAVFTAETVVGAVAGIAVAAHGVDTFQAGIRNAFGPGNVDTFTSQGLQAVGVPRGTANLLDAGIGVVGSVATAPGRITAAAAQQAIDNAPTAFQQGARTWYYSGVANDAVNLGNNPLQAIRNSFGQISTSAFDDLGMQGLSSAEKAKQLWEAQGLRALWPDFQALRQTIGSGPDALTRWAVGNAGYGAAGMIGIGYASNQVSGRTDWFGRLISNRGK